jgi:hypothetical protein
VPTQTDVTVQLIRNAHQRYVQPIPAHLTAQLSNQMVYTLMAANALIILNASPRTVSAVLASHLVLMH